MRVVVAGAGLGGLMAALQLARAGIDVVLLEPDAAGPALPPDALTSWSRPGAPQTRQAHIFLPLARTLLAARLPDVYAQLLAAGARETDLRPHLPAGQLDDERERDLVALSCRRFLLEGALRRAVERERRVDLRTARAVDVVGGVLRTESDPIAADLLVDAAGRRTPLPAALAARGEPVSRDSQQCGVTYLTRYYRLSGDEPTALFLGLATRIELLEVSVAMFRADDGVFMVTFGVRPDDRELRRALVAPAAFDAAAGRLPGVREWTSPRAAEPVTGVLVMGGLTNTLVRFGELSMPYVAIGDALCTTNPQLGWGTALAFLHADLLRRHLADQSAARAAAATRQAVHADAEVRWRAAVREDARRLRWWGGLGWEPADGQKLVRAGGDDRAVLVAAARRIGALDHPDAHLSLTPVRAAVQRAAAELRREGPPSGPSRTDLLDAVARSPLVT